MVIDMKTLKKEYHVDTGNCSCFCLTLAHAIDEYNMWIDFYEKNFGKYGNRTITLSHKGIVIYSMSFYDDEQITL